MWSCPNSHAGRSRISFTRIVDLCNLCLDIVGEEVVQEGAEVVRHERSCLLSGVLRARVRFPASRGRAMSRSLLIFSERRLRFSF